MGLQAVLLTSAALTAEVKTLKENLERSENELGHAKRQVEEKEGKKYLAQVYREDVVAKNDRINVLL